MRDHTNFSRIPGDCWSANNGIRLHGSSCSKSCICCQNFDRVEDSPDFWQHRTLPSQRDIGLVKKRSLNRNLNRNLASTTTEELNHAIVTIHLQQSSTLNNTANLMCFEEEKDITGEENASDLPLMFSGPACWFCYSILKRDLPCYCSRCGFLNSGPARPGSG